MSRPPLLCEEGNVLSHELAKLKLSHYPGSGISSDEFDRSVRLRQRAQGFRDGSASPTNSNPLRGLISKSRRFRFIEGPVQYALLAKGSVDVAMDAVMHPWDIAALAPCIEEAGGVVSDLEGHREGIIWRPNLIGASTTELHKQVLSALRGVG